MEYDAPTALLEDVRVTLENEGKFYTWCLKWLQKTTVHRFGTVMGNCYKAARALSDDQQRHLLEYFKWRFLTKMETPPPTMPRPWNAHDHIVGIDKTGAINAFGVFNKPIAKFTVTADENGRSQIMDYASLKQRIVAQLSTESVARANCDAQVNTLFQQMNTYLKEIPVSKLTFKQQFLLNGTDISSIPNEQIYVLIQQEETRIANLEKIQTKPKRLTAEIEEAKANLAAIVAHLDSK